MHAFLRHRPMKMSIAVTGALCAAAVTTAAIAAKPTTRNRAEIPAEYRWDFSAIYPSWAAWEAGMKEMDARMDAFAKLQGNARARARGAAQGLPVVRRDRQAAVPPLPLSAAAARRRHARPGGRRPLPARQRGVRQVRDRVGVVHARAAEDPGGDGRRRGSRRRRRSRRTASRSSTTIASKAHVLDDKGERLLSLAGQFNGAPATIYQELSTSDIKFPTLRLADGSDVVLQPGQLRRAAREEPRPGRARQGGRGTRRHLRRDRATPTRRSTTARCSATGSSPRRATSRPRSTPRSTATRSRAPSSRR